MCRLSSKLKASWTRLPEEAPIENERGGRGDLDSHIQRPVKFLCLLNRAAAARGFFLVQGATLNTHHCPVASEAKTSFPARKARSSILSFFFMGENDIQF